MEKAFVAKKIKSSTRRRLTIGYVEKTYGYSFRDVDPNLSVADYFRKSDFPELANMVESFEQLSIA